MRFDNSKQKWLVEILNSSEAEVSLEEKNQLMKDKTVSEMIVKTSEIIFDKASEKYISIVMPMIEEGNFLNVDEAKAEALRDFLQDRDLRTAFEKKTFVK